jgi:hypothetical protein
MNWVTRLEPNNRFQPFSLAETAWDATDRFDRLGKVDVLRGQEAKLGQLDEYCLGCSLTATPGCFFIFSAIDVDGFFFFLIVAILFPIVEVETPIY